MEFVGGQYGPQDALAILLALGNGQGGGDLGQRGSMLDRSHLVGSWAGDRVAVVGDYYEEEKYHPREFLDEDGSARFYKNDDGRQYKYTAYHIAQTEFEDISDKIIKVIVRGEGGDHPWAALDSDKKGRRSVWPAGMKPDREVTKPLLGKKIFDKYMGTCKDIPSYEIDMIQTYLRGLGSSTESRKELEKIMHRLSKMWADTFPEGNRPQPLFEKPSTEENVSEIQV